MVVEKPDNKMAPLNNGQDCNEDSENYESVFQSLGEFMVFLMGNEGLKHIADKIFGAVRRRYIRRYSGNVDTYYEIDMVSLANLRLVSRAFRDYLDNHMSMLHLQIKHFRKFEFQTTEKCGSWRTIAPHREWIQYGLFDYIENEVKDVSKLRTFLGLLRDISSNKNQFLIESPFRYMVNNHMHKELELLMDSPLPIHGEDGYDQWVDELYEWPSYIFHYACASGCGECVQPLLDHVGDKFIDVNWTRGYFGKSCLHAAFENDFEKGESDSRFRPRVLPLLLRNISAKGINVDALNMEGYTVKERVIQKYKWEMEHYDDGWHNCVYAFGPDEHEVYKMLGIDTDDYPRKDEEDESNSNSSSDSSSDSSSTSGSESTADLKSDSNSSSDSSSTSDSEANWETVSNTDTDPDA